MEALDRARRQQQDLLDDNDALLRETVYTRSTPPPTAAMEIKPHASCVDRISLDSKERVKDSQRSNHLSYEARRDDASLITFGSSLLAQPTATSGIHQIAPPPPPPPPPPPSPPSPRCNQMPSTFHHVQLSADCTCGDRSRWASFGPIQQQSNSSSSSSSNNNNNNNNNDNKTTSPTACENASAATPVATLAASTTATIISTSE
nr:unnamed protein product [Spirometra erinaceieuropaei]